MPFLRNAVAEEVLQRFVREAAKIPRTYLQRTMNLVSETSFVERLSSVSIPVLVVSSVGDPVHTTERDLVGSFPQARVEVIDAGAEIPMEQPAAFARTLDRFLREIEAA